MHLPYALQKLCTKAPSSEENVKYFCQQKQETPSFFISCQKLFNLETLIIPNLINFVSETILKSVLNTKETNSPQDIKCPNSGFSSPLVKNLAKNLTQHNWIITVIVN